MSIDGRPFRTGPRAGTCVGVSDPEQVAQIALRPPVEVTEARNTQSGQHSWRIAGERVSTSICSNYLRA
jgi:hypothetical protein